MHTKGPWTIRGQDIYGADGMYICKWSGKSANARLIASAPDMFNFIDSLANAEYLDDKSLDYYIEEARKVFRKAKGD